jgi:hypothetical protein
MNPIFQLLISLLLVPFIVLADTSGLDDIVEIIGNMQDAILKIGGAFCVLMLIIGGGIYMTSREDPNQTKMGLATIKYALFGLMIVSAAAMLLDFLNFGK